MKELIDRLNEVRGNIFNSDRYAGISDDQPEHDDMQTVLDAIVALESAEAREAELRTDNTMLKMEHNSLQKLVAKEQEENAELRAEVERLWVMVAELEEENLSLRAKVPRWVPDSEVKAPLQVVPIPLWNGHALCVLTLPALPEAPHD